ncbi:hypothetical protein ACMGG8_07680 [Pseudomonas sp. BNK-45]|uniref:hypothetical protein n=1 Tax=Pseudomonas sp. BNK-45 TaxID=3376180 RepID=UPI0039BFD3A4
MYLYGLNWKIVFSSQLQQHENIACQSDCLKQLIRMLVELALEVEMSKNLEQNRCNTFTPSNACVDSGMTLAEYFGDLSLSPSAAPPLFSAHPLTEVNKSRWRVIDNTQNIKTYLDDAFTA